jgi:hypothetical protein
MDELENELELRKFNKWRKEIGKTLPELASRVFALRTKGYMGCGFHWSLEKDLGYIIAIMNDFDRDYRDFDARIAVEVKYKCFIERLKEIENEISQRTRKM